MGLFCLARLDNFPLGQQAWMAARVARLMAAWLP
jgi:hypothetical protein